MSVRAGPARKHKVRTIIDAILHPLRMVALPAWALPQHRVRVVQDGWRTTAGWSSFIMRFLRYQFRVSCIRTSPIS
jgi:hypothetical protein